MKNLFFIIVIGVLFCSCNNYLDKSIYEPLSVQELKKAIEKDSIFQDIYEYIQVMNNSVLTTDLAKVKFVDLTYRRLYKFAKFAMDTTYFNPIEKKAEKEWIENYNHYQLKVDSISDYWKEEKKSLTQYVDIELVDMRKEYYSYSGDIKNVKLGFRLTPLKGTVETLWFRYQIEKKTDEEDGKSSYRYGNLCLEYTSFSKPILKYYEVDYTNKKILMDETLETFLTDYSVHIEVDRIRTDGVSKSIDDLNIPQSVQNYWRAPDLYFDDVVKEFLNKDFLSKYEYKGREVEKILRKKDSLSFEFINLNMSI